MCRNGDEVKYLPVLSNSPACVHNVILTQCDQSVFVCQMYSYNKTSIKLMSSQTKCTLHIYNFMHCTALPTVILSLQSGGNRNTNNVKTEIMAQGIIKYIA